MLAGTWSLEDFSHRLDEFEELAEGFRRWAFESAGARSRAPAERARPRRGARAPGAAGPLRRLDTRRSRALARVRARARVQARRREGLGPAAAAGPARARPRARRRPEGVLPRHRRRPRARSRALPRDRRRSCRRRSSRTPGWRTAARGARRRRGSPQLRRARPLAGRPRRAAARAALAEHQAVALRHGARAARDDRGLRGARDQDVRRRPVRARPGPSPDPAPRERLLPRRPERRRAVGVQRGRAARGPAAEPAAGARGAGF